MKIMLSQNINITLDTKNTKFGSYIVIDSKGKLGNLCRDNGGFLYENGYSIKVLNLVD